MATTPSNPPKGVWEAGEPPDLIEDLRIGDTDGGGPAPFGAVSLFEVSDRGRLWVFDTHSQEVRVFDLEGPFLGSVQIPFPFQTNPPPIIRGGYFYAVSTNELDVPFLARARFHYMRTEEERTPYNEIARILLGFSRLPERALSPWIPFGRVANHRRSAVGLPFDRGGE